MSLEPKRAYKIVLIGDPEVGKTSIRRQYMGKSFRTDYLKTLGADFAAQKVNIEGEVVLLTIWDLAGQSIFHGMRSSFYHGCKCALIVFDVTNTATLNNSLKWAEEATQYAKDSLQEIYLIGNKIDLDDSRLVEQEDIVNTAQKIQQLTKFSPKIYETSALTGTNINELFEHMSKKLILGDTTDEKNYEMPDRIESRVESTTVEKNPQSTEDEIKQLKLMLESLEKKIEDINSSLKAVKGFINKKT